MTKHEFVDLVSLSNVVLTEFEKQDNRKHNKVVVTKIAEPATVVVAVTSHIPDVVISATNAVDVDKVPFSVTDVATLAIQPYYSYDDQCVSLETQCGDAGVA